ncbi:conserved hypothetical protein [Candidatus Methylobacter favarea]|uniref:Uncharacterized protein n=1 Tax=Candidatus Methylobacter favarea TaxID=2707345 RepID=A0A8S0WR09_9GAMM|nr:hypothetical protein [Candidatus Methylobacter favarea]CAA9891739.1 conserved hypothetical protein [Candidatus Methylobacter favarea]
MKYSRFFATIIQQIILALLVFYAINTPADEDWIYHQDRDRATNAAYSFARSPLPRHDLYDEIRLEIVCKENKLQAVIDTETLITSQDRTFNLEYQIDKNPAVTIQMRTFKDSKRRAYTKEYAKRIADDILTGQAIFIRINTLIGRVLSGSMPLTNAATPIKRVFTDCGIELSEKNADETAYSLADFEQDFSKLSTEQQQQVLNKIQKIMMEIR